MTSTNTPYQGKKVLILGLGKNLPPGIEDSKTFAPNVEEIMAQVQKANADLRALGFEVYNVSVNPRNLVEDTLIPIREIMQGGGDDGAGVAFDVVSVGGAVRKLDESVPAFERLTWFLCREGVGRVRSVPRFAYPAGPSDIVESVKRVLEFEELM